MGARLLANVALRNPGKGSVVVLLKGEEIPSWADSLVGQHLRATGKGSETPSESPSQPGGTRTPNEEPQDPEEDDRSPEEDVSAYTDLTVAQLREEVDTRNALRSEDDRIILPSHRKGDIVNALETDDIR